VNNFVTNQERRRFISLEKIGVKNLGAGVLMGLLVFPVQSQAAVGKYFVKGDSASAFFFEESGCLSTYVSVGGYDLMEKSHWTPGPSDRFSGAGGMVFIGQFDACSNVSLVEATCSNATPLADGELNVMRRLEAATLRTTLECFDWLGGPAFSVYADITWVAVGDPEPQTSNMHSRSPGLITHSRVKGTFREAEAYGTITFGTTYLVFGPSAPETASIARITSGHMNITKP